METAAKAYRQPGTAVKRLSGNRFGGYLVRFTNESRRDLTGEWFDDQTDFMLSAYPVKGYNALYHHSDDAAIRAIPLSQIDTAEYHPGEGIWAEAENNFAKHYKDYLQGLKAPDEWKRQQEQLAQQYQDMLDEMIDKGMLGWSSGALPKSVVVENGHIKSWAIIEGSLTPTPAEPLGTRVTTMKAAFDALFREPVEVRETADPTPQRDIELLNQDKTSTGETTMKRSAIKAQISDRVAELLAALVEELGVGMAETEVEAAQAAMVEEATTALDEEMDKAEDMPDEEAGKAISAKLNEKIGEIVNAGAKAYYEAKSNREKGNRETVRNIIKGLQTAPAESPKQKAGAAANGNGRISVSESLKYAHLPAETMALAVKVAAASYAPQARKNLTLQHMIDDGLISEDFVKSAAHKSANAMKAFAPSNDPLIAQDHAATKSAMPFKADELDAVAITNQGAEWISVFYDTRLWERARVETLLFNMLVDKGMRVVDIPQGARSMNVKMNTSSPTVFTRGEPRSTDATGRPEVTAQITPWGTNEVEEAANEHVIASAHSHQLDEDSVINVAQFLEADMVQTLAESLEGTIINGDKTTTASSNINLIDGTPGTGLSAPDYLAWDGIRHTFLIDFTGQASNQGGVALSAVDLESLLMLFPVEIVTRRQQMLFVMDYKTESSIRKFPELLTVDVAGDTRATLFAGKVPPLFNVDVYMSGKMGLSNSAGKVSVTPGNNTLGTLACVYAPYWQYGRKRQVSIETERYALSGSTAFVASVRHVLKARGAGAAVGKYNILV